MDLNPMGEVLMVSAIEHKSNVINHKSNHQRKPVGLLRPMNTDTGTPDASEVVELNKRIKILEADNGVNKRKLILYEENIKRLSIFVSGGGGLSSKHKRNKKGSGDDVDTCLANLTCYLMMQVWHRVKMLPKNGRIGTRMRSRCVRSYSGKLGHGFQHAFWMKYFGTCTQHLPPVRCI